MSQRPASAVPVPGTALGEKNPRFFFEDWVYSHNGDGYIRPS